MSICLQYARNATLPHFCGCHAKLLMDKGTSDSRDYGMARKIFQFAAVSFHIENVALSISDIEPTAIDAPFISCIYLIGLAMIVKCELTKTIESVIGAKLIPCAIRMKHPVVLKLKKSQLTKSTARQ